jgi:hypothetical protein
MLIAVAVSMLDVFVDTRYTLRALTLISSCPRALGKIAVQPHSHTTTNLVSVAIDYS